MFRKSSIDLSKNVGDLNMKLKMEVGALRSENEGLLRSNEAVRNQILDLEDKIQVRSKETGRAFIFPQSFANVPLPVSLLALGKPQKRVLF